MPDPVLSLFLVMSGATPGTLKLRLYQRFTPSVPIPQLANFVEAAYTGYSPQLVSSFKNAQLQADGSYQMLFRNITFAVALGEQLGCDVAGFYLTLVIDTEECVVEQVSFGSLAPMQQPGDYVQFDAQISAGLSTIPPA